jgi:hypothetical protein
MGADDLIESFIREITLLIFVFSVRPCGSEMFFSKSCTSVSISRSILTARAQRSLGAILGRC